MAAGTTSPPSKRSAISVLSVISSRWLFLGACVASAGAVLFLYTWKLGQAQPYFNHDEAGFGLAAHLLATTGRDYFNNLLPVYVGYLDNHQLGGAIQSYWAIPFVKAMGLSVESVRLSMAVIGLISLGMFGFLSWRVSRSRWIALLGMWLLATTPLFFIQSRIFLDVVMPVPFVVGWLLCLAEMERRKSGLMLMVSAVILGVGTYSYGTARMIMPAYLGLTLLLAFVSRACSWRVAAGAAALFAVTMIPLLAFAAGDPDLFLTRYRQLTWLEDEGVTAASVVPMFLNNFARSFDLLDLFVRGDASLIHSTGTAGSFLWASLPLVLTGMASTLWRAVSRREPIQALLPLALLLFPLPLGLIAESHDAARGTYVAPIYVALCVLGAQVIVGLVGKYRLGAVALGLVIVGGATESAAFFNDYFGPYGPRSTAQVEFEGNKRGAFTALFRGAAGGQVYYDVENTSTTTFARFFKAESRFSGGVDPAPPEWADRLPVDARLLTTRPERYGRNFQLLEAIPELAPNRPPHVILRKVANP